VLTSREEGATDVHLRCLEYRRQYLANFMGAAALSGAVENRLTRERHASEAACLESLLENNRLLLESLYPALGGQGDSSRSFNRLLGSAEVGVVRLPLAQVSVVCQLGTDVSAGAPLPVLVMGRRADASAAAYVLTLQHATTSSGRATLQLGVKELLGALFGQTPNSAVRDVQFCRQTGQLVVQTAEEVALYGVRADEAGLVTERRRSLVPCEEGTRTVKLDDGRAYVQAQGAITAYSLRPAGEREPSKASGPTNSQDRSARARDEDPATQPSSPINPDTVTIQDLQRYEALMKGKAVSAASNAHAPRGGQENTPPLHKRHTWIARGEAEFGPMQVRFESAANLISLNIDLTFSCRDPAGLLAATEALPEATATSSLVAEDLAQAAAGQGVPALDSAADARVDLRKPKQAGAGA
jgi:hypothetical protein